MAITPQTPGSIAPPISKTAESAGSVATPIAKTAESAGSVATPISKTAESAGSVVAPIAKTAESAGTIATPISKTAESAGSIVAPISKTAETAGSVVAPIAKTAVGAAAFPRTFVPNLDLDFKNELYAQNGAPKALSDLTTFSRSSTATYLDRALDLQGDWNYFINTAISGALRIEYDQATGESLGALIESASTNLALRSEEFDNASWTKSNSTITANDTKGPDNSTSADKLEAGSTGTIAPIIFQQITSVATNSYTISAYIKRSEASFIQLYFESSHVANNPRVNFDLSTGVIGSQDADIDAASLTPIGNDWFRISATVEAVGTSLNAVSLLVKSATDTRAQTNAWTSGDGLFIWGAQIEEQAAPTSYIKTEGSTVSRLADLLSAPTAGNMPLGDVTFYADVHSLLNLGASTRIFEIDAAPSDYGAFVLSSGVLAVSMGGTQHEIAASGSFGNSFNVTSVLNRSENNFKGFLNGVQVINADNGQISQINIGGVVGIGNASPNTAAQLNGHIKQLTIIDKALTSQEVSLL